MEKVILKEMYGILFLLIFMFFITWKKILKNIPKILIVLMWVIPPQIYITYLFPIRIMYLLVCAF